MLKTRRSGWALALPAAFTLCAALLPTLSHAGPDEYVHTPTVEYGEKEIDFKAGYQRHRDGSSDAAQSLGLGWGATPWWFTEVYAKFHREAGESHAFDAWEWENRFQLTDPGRYFVDLGLLLEIERPKDRAEGYEITWGPLLQKDWGKLQGNFNLLLQKHVRLPAPAEESITELKYQLQLKYRHTEALEWGAQALGSFGQWNDWSPSSQQEHKIGPALFGKVKLGGHQAIKWNAAALFGTTNATARTTLRLQAEYEF